ncbi:MAG: ROK family protein, partial [Candidatus Kerfeldbacteria bacterium]|nr:ROK family protein [Candidatus Kerfeldbacteria bacterium]
MNTLLFDIGATKTRFALAHHGRLGRVTTLPTPSRWRDVEPAYRRAMINVLAGRSVAAAVGGIPGTLNQKTGGVIRASNLRGWDQQPITAVLRRVFSVRRVRIENDANLAGLGEAVYGAGRGFRIVAYLGIGTGVGGTRIIDRHLDPAPTGFRPGHQVIDRSSHARCGCGQRGDLESLISGRGLARLYHRPAEELPRRVFISAARTLGIGLNNIT